VYPVVEEHFVPAKYALHQRIRSIADSRGIEVRRAADAALVTPSAASSRYGGHPMSTHACSSVLGLEGEVDRRPTLLDRARGGRLLLYDAARPELLELSAAQ
jgi:hypothetical protein